MLCNCQCNVWIINFESPSFLSYTAIWRTHKSHPRHALTLALTKVNTKQREHHVPGVPSKKTRVFHRTLMKNINCKSILLSDGNLTWLKSAWHPASHRFTKLIQSSLLISVKTDETVENELLYNLVWCISKMPLNSLYFATIKYHIFTLLWLTSTFVILYKEMIRSTFLIVLILRTGAHFKLLVVELSWEGEKH